MTILHVEKDPSQQGQSAPIMLVIGSALLGIVALIFLHPGLRQWISREGESLQIIDAVMGVLLSLGTYFIHPIWLILGKLKIIPPNVQVPKLLTRAINWPKKYRRIIIIAILLISLTFYVTIGIVIATTPVFKITSPRNGTTIISTFLGITVEGRGAEPGGIVKVYVFDGHETYLQQETSKIDQNGNWSVDNVVLQTENYEYTIWAETMIDEVLVSTINRPRVIRKSSSILSIFNLSIGVIVTAFL